MSIIHKIRQAHREKRLYAAIQSKTFPILNGLTHTFYNPARDIKIHCPEYVDPDPQDNKLVQRIFAAFKKMKEAQKKAPAYFSPSSMWQKQLNDTYSYLLDGLKDNDLEKFHFFLAKYLSLL